MRIPPELISALLTALAIGGTVLGVFLTRRGKKEDVRLAQIDQNFDHMRELAADRLSEITELRAALRQSREETASARAETVAARAEAERIRVSWEDRWGRQMVRCRTVTEPLVAAITALQLMAGPDMQRDVDAVKRTIAAHNQDDHPDPAPNT